MNKFFAAFLLIWIASWAVILTQPSLTNAPQDKMQFLLGEAVVGIFASVLFWMTRKQKPVDHTAIKFKAARKETIWLIIFMIIVIAVGLLLGVRGHVGSLGLTEQTYTAWDAQSTTSLFLWAAYFGIFGALVPFLAFRKMGYTKKDMLLDVPGKKWIPYMIVTGILGILGFATAEYFSTPLTGHLATVIIFTVGTFLPVMILTQSLIAPRLAVLSKSWLTGAVLAGFVYAIYHITEFYFVWNQPVVSIAWLIQFAYFGFIKAFTTLRTGNAWIHIFNTHTPHLAEAPEVHRIVEGS